MDKYMKLLGWAIAGVFGGQVINSVVHNIIYDPSDGIDTTKAFISAIFGAAFLGYCIYRGYKGFRA